MFYAYYIFLLLFWHETIADSNLFEPFESTAVRLVSHWVARSAQQNKAHHSALRQAQQSIVDPGDTSLHRYIVLMMIASFVKTYNSPLFTLWAQRALLVQPSAGAWKKPPRRLNFLVKNNCLKVSRNKNFKNWWQRTMKWRIL